MEEGLLREGGQDEIECGVDGAGVWALDDLVSVGENDATSGDGKEVAGDGIELAGDAIELEEDTIELDLVKIAVELAGEEI